MSKKITVIIKTDSLMNKSDITKTIVSIENQSFSWRTFIKIILILPENDSALKKLAEFYLETYKDNYEVHYSDFQDITICKILNCIDGDYVTIADAGDVFSSGAFKSAYNYIEKVKGNADIAGMLIQNVNEKYAFYNNAFKEYDYNVHLLQNSELFPKTMKGLFVKSNVIREKSSGMEKYDETSLLINIFSRRNNMAALSCENFISDSDIYRSDIHFSVNDFSACIDKLISICSSLKQKNGFLYNYIQNMVLSDVMNIFNNSEDLMGQYHHPDYDYSEIWEKFSSLLSEIDDNIIMDFNTTRFNKIFFLSHKYKRPCNLDIFYDDFTIMYNNTAAYDFSSFPVRLELMEIENDSLIIEGISHVPACFEMSDFAANVMVNGKIIECEQVERLSDRYYFDRVYAYEKGFKAVIPLTEKSFSLKFVNNVNSIRCVKKKIEFMDMFQLDGTVEGQYYYKDGYMLTVKDNEIIYHLSNEADRAEQEEIFQNSIMQKEPERADEIIEIRNYFWENYRNKKKQIWLLTDRTDRADDNADVLFSYLSEINDEDIDVYFILSNQSEAYQRLRKTGKVIEPFSAEHKKLQVIADFVISSQMTEAVNNPFNDDVCYFRDMFRRSEFIFLQHGVINNDHGKVMGRFGRNFRGFVTSAYGEYEAMLEPKFHLTKDEVWLTGLPRWDKLYRDDKRKITIIPTWRKFLTTRVFDEEANTKVWRVNDNFTSSRYFNFYNDLINNDELLDAAEKYGYEICFMPHVMFLKHVDEFTHNERVTIYEYEKNYREVYAESSLLVTDYSSAIFDFVYMHQPVVYCHFDEEEFYSGHTYKKGYFDTERDGFGEVEYTLEDTVKRIIEYMENDCKLKDIYRERIDNFFAYNDKENCRRVYEKIKSIEITGNPESQKRISEIYGK